jgi:hypothetical protein
MADGNLNTSNPAPLYAVSDDLIYYWLAVDLLRKLNTLILLTVDLPRKLNTSTCGSCMPSAKGRHTTASCVLVDTGDFYLGGVNSSRTPVLQLVVRSYRVLTGGPAYSRPASPQLLSVMCARSPGMIVCSVGILWYLMYVYD